MPGPIHLACDLSARFPRFVDGDRPTGVADSLLELCLLGFTERPVVRRTPRGSRLKAFVGS